MNMMSLGTRLKRKGIRSSKVRTDYFPYAGGLNLDGSPLEIKPGELRDVKNFEPNTKGGYARSEGIERFDGRPRPSKQIYKQYFLGGSERSTNKAAQAKMRKLHDWTDSGTISKWPEYDGPDGVSKSATIVRDDDESGSAAIEYEVTGLTADKSMYVGQIMLRKIDSSAGIYPSFNIQNSAGGLLAEVTIDLETGRIVDRHTALDGIKTAGCGVIDYSTTYWLVWVALVSDGSTTGIKGQLFPARSNVFDDTAVAAATGQVIADNYHLYNVDASAAYPTRGINATIGQLLRLERELDDGTQWTKTGSPTLTLDKVGYDGVSAAAYTINDTDLAAHEDVTQSVTVAADHKMYLFSAYVEKQSEAQTYYPALRANLGSGLRSRSLTDGTVRTLTSGEDRTGDVGNDVSVIIDNYNGVLYDEDNRTPESSFHQGIASYNSNWWRVWLLIQNNGVDTTAEVYLSPARASGLTGAADVGATGKTAFDLPIFKEFPFDVFIPLNQSALPKDDDALPNLLFAPREMDGNAWGDVGTPAVAMDAVGYQSYPNSAATITDDSATVTEGIASATVINLPTSYSSFQGQALIKKTTGAITAYPALLLLLGAITATVVIDTTNGTITEGSNVRNSGIQSYDSNYWLVWLVGRHDGTNGTTRLTIKASYNADGTATEAVAATGAAGIDVPALFDLSRGQLLQEDREFSTSPWSSSGSPTFGTAETGYDGQASLALNIIDGNSGAHAYVEQSVTILADLGLYLCQVFVEKESSAPSNYPVLEVEIGSTTPRVVIDTYNGAVVEVTGTLPVSSGIKSYNASFWVVWMEVAGDGSATTAKTKLYPAAANNLTGVLAITLGNRTFDHCIFRKLYQYDFTKIAGIRDLSDSSWVATGSPAATQDAVGYDGVSNKAWTLTDNDAAAHEFLNQNITVTANRSVYLCQVLVGKVSGTPSYYPVIAVGDISGGNYGAVSVDNSENGTLTALVVSSVLDSGIVDYNERYWLVWLTVQNDNTSTSWDVRLYPAGATALTVSRTITDGSTRTLSSGASRSLGLGGLDVASAGATVFDRPELFEWAHDYRTPVTDPSIDPIAKAQVPPTTNTFPAAALGNSLDQGFLSPRVLDSTDWTNVGVPIATRNVTGYDGQANRGYTITDNRTDRVEGIKQSAAIPGSIGHTFVVQAFFKKETTETGVFHVMRLISTSSLVHFDAFKGEILRAEAWKHQIVDLGVHDYSSTYWLAWFQFEASAASGISDFASAQFDLWAAAADLYNRSESTLAENVLLTGSASVDFLSIHKDYTKPHYGLVNASCASSPFVVIGSNGASGETLYDGELVMIGGKVCGQVSGSPITEHSTASLDATWAAGVIEDARDQIKQVPGTGDSSGVVQYNGVAYGFRNIVNGKNIDGGIWKSSSAGWIPLHVISTAVGGVPRAVFNPKLTFESGITEPSEGDIIQDHGAVNKARVLRVVKKSGSWGSSAAGFIITSFFEDGIDSSWATGNILNAAGTSTIATSTAGAPQIREPDGRSEFGIENFYGHAAREAIYGANGVDKAIELHPDGQQEIITLIETDMTIDKPTHIATWNSYLWLSFRGGSIQNSGLGVPLAWNVVLGTDEIGLGEEVSAFLTEKDEAMLIFGREGTSILYDDGSTFVLKELEDESGCIPYTAQKVFRGFYLDDQGITRTEAVLSYGNFKAASISENVDSLVNDLREDAVSSHVSRRKNLYRISFKDAAKTNLAVGFVGNKVTGITKTNLGITILTSHSREDDEGVERIFAGTDDGYIYELDSGNSLDGDTLDFELEPAFNHAKSPGQSKHLRGVSLDIVTNGAATFDITPEFEYGENPTLESDPAIAITSKKNTLIKVRMDGDGTNYRNKITGGQNDEPSWEIHGQTNQFSGRRLDREERKS